MYGLTQENEKLIIEKAKTKANGVFTFRGVGYRVRNGKLPISRLMAMYLKGLLALIAKLDAILALTLMAYKC